MLTTTPDFTKASAVYVKTLLALFALIIFRVESFAQTPALTNDIYRLIEISDSFYATPGKKVYYHHLFQYNKNGQPITHQWDYFKNGKLYSSSKMFYNYDKNGRLLSKKGDLSKYNYFYDSLGRLARITLELFNNKKWSLNEETLIQEGKDITDSTRLVTLTLNKRRFDGPRKNLIDRYSKIEYGIDASNNIIKSKTIAYHYNEQKVPILYTYEYDNKPNPLQNLFIERWYEFDLESSGLTNVTVKKSGNNFTPLRTYEYNEAGYPTKYLIGARVKHFKYEIIKVPAQRMVDTLKPNQATGSFLVYPNPATTEVTVKADNLGEGFAHLRIFDVNGIVHRSVKYAVSNKLQALIPLSGLQKGTYFIEIIVDKLILRRTLLIL